MQSNAFLSALHCISRPPLSSVITAMAHCRRELSSCEDYACGLIRTLQASQCEPVVPPHWQKTALLPTSSRGSATGHPMLGRSTSENTLSFFRLCFTHEHHYHDTEPLPRRARPCGPSQTHLFHCAALLGLLQTLRIFEFCSFVLF